MLFLPDNINDNKNVFIDGFYCLILKNWLSFETVILFPVTVSILVPLKPKFTHVFLVLQRLSVTYEITSFFIGILDSC